MDSPGEKFGNQDCSLHCSPSEGFRYLAVVCFVVVFNLFFIPDLSVIIHGQSPVETG